MSGSQLTELLRHGQNNQDQSIISQGGNVCINEYLSREKQLYKDGVNQTDVVMSKNNSMFGARDNHAR